MIQVLEFYLCFVLAVVIAAWFLSVMLYKFLGVNAAKMFLVLVVLASGLMTGAWFFVFVSVYSPR